MPDKAQTPVDLNKLLRVYVKIRAARDELRQKHKEEIEALEEKLDAIKTSLLDYCKTNKCKGAVSNEGHSFSRQTRTRYWVSDWEAMHRFVLENKAPELLEKRVQQTNMSQFINDNPDLIVPGLKMDSEYVISVRKKREKSDD